MSLYSGEHQSATNDRLRLCYVIGTYPEMTITFIDREIQTLRRCGVDLQVLAIRRPAANAVLSLHQQELQQGVIYLLPVEWLGFIFGQLHFVLSHPLCYFKTLVYLLTRPHPNLKSRLMTSLHFAEGVHAAHLLREQSVNHLHAHFLDRAALVALVASRLLGIRYSLAVHAGGDIYVHPILLPEKIAEAKFIISCTQYNLDYLKRLDIPGLDEKAVCVHHGVDIERYPPANRPQKPPLLLCVGQLVEKKGLEYLIRACRRLVDQKQEFVCHIIGLGPNRQKLEALIAELGLQGIVKLCGGLPHEKVIEQYSHATIFAIPCIRGDDGNRDGIPNVLAEAMAMKLPVVSTTVSAIPELVQDEVNGLLVPARDEKALTSALTRLLDDPLLCGQLGEKGRQTVMEHFNVNNNVRAVYDLFMSHTGPKHVS